MKLFLAILIIIIGGCNSNAPIDDPIKKLSDNNSATDSLKWIYYVYNYSDSAVFHEIDSPYKKIKFDPVECDIKLDGSSTRGEDSIYYRFSLIKPGHNFGYIEGGIASMLGIFNGTVTPVMQHGIMDFTKFPDSVRLRYDIANKKFYEYLKNYKGNLGNWLQKEKLRRNINTN